MSLKPLLLHAHYSGANPWKVAIILEELNIPYNIKFWDFADLKKPPFEKLNPNGRVPVLEDLNTGLTLFESGAIIEYLIEKYDKEGKLAYLDGDEKFLTKSWLHFQTSGQGPYFGQFFWFSFLHPEKLPSAIERYKNEVNRVWGVIDRHLKAQGTDYLVGDRITYADIAFVAYDAPIQDKFGLFEVFNAKETLPYFVAWHKRIAERPSVKKILAERDAAIKAEEAKKQ